MKFLPNQKVSLIKLVDGTYRVISKQDRSTPGCYMIYNFIENKEYKITVNGTVETDCKVILWILNIANNKFILKSFDYDLNKGNINYTFKSYGNFKTHVGLMIIDAKINDSFHITSFNIIDLSTNPINPTNPTQLTNISREPYIQTNFIQNKIKEITSPKKPIILIGNNINIINLIDKKYELIIIDFKDNIQNDKFNIIDNKKYYTYNINNKDYNLEKVKELIDNNQIVIINGIELGKYIYDIINRFKFMIYINNNDNDIITKKILYISKRIIIDNDNLIEQLKEYENKLIKLDDVNYKNKINFWIKNDTKKNIGFYVDSLDIGGLEQTFYNIVVGMDRSLFNILIIVKTEGGMIYNKLKQNGYAIIPINNNLNKLDEILKTYNIELVNVHHSNFGYDIYKRHNIKIVVTLHNNFNYLTDNEKTSFKININKVDKYIPVSGYVKKCTINLFNILDSMFEVIENGVDINILNIKNNYNDEFIKDTDYVYINVARISQSKCQLLVLNAFNMITTGNDNKKLLFVGNIGNDIYYDNLKKRIIELKLQHKVKILMFQSIENLVGIYKRANCLVLPSLIEGCSNVVFEAMLFNVPMILSNCGTALDAINNSNNYGVVINKDIDETKMNYSQIITYRNSYEYQSKLAKEMDEIRNKKFNKSCDKVLNEYSLTKMANNYMNVFINI